MEKLKEFYSSNLPWKILSIVLGFSIWAIGMNINNPTVTDIVKVDLRLNNTNYIQEKGLALLNYDELSKMKINVNIKGPRIKVDEVKDNNKDIITASIDFKPANVTNNANVGDKIEILINVQSNDSQISIMGFSPTTVPVIFDEVSTVTKTVNVTPNGTLDEKYIYDGYPYANPSKVQISGAQSILDDIYEVKAGVDVEGANESFTIKSDLKVYDYNGEDITDSIVLSTDYVDINVNVSKSSSIPVLEPTLLGETKSGIEIASVITEPSSIEVVGDDSSFSGVEYITIDPIDVSGISGTTEFTYDVRDYLSQYGLSVKEGTPYEVTTTVEVDKYERAVFRFYSDDILIKGLKPEITGPSYIDITFEGKKEDIENLKVEDIEISLDLRSLEEGVNTITVEGVLPEGIRFLNNVTPTVDVYYEELTDDANIEENTN